MQVHDLGHTLNVIIRIEALVSQTEIFFQFTQILIQRQKFSLGFLGNPKT